jgi:hypothetical protein
MTNAVFLDYIKTIGQLLLSWPAVALITIFVLRHHLGPSAEHLGELLGNLRKAKFGPVQFEAFERFVERGQTTLSTIEKINVEIAKSRIIELEVSRILFSEDQIREVNSQIDNLRKYISQLDGPI